MSEAARARAVEQLGRFNDEMTAVIDDVFGTEWAEIEEMIAIVVLASRASVTTRSLAEVSGLDRRALSRLIVRLRSEGLVTTRPSKGDKRAVDVVLTDLGKRQAETLRSSITAFFHRSADIAREVIEGLNPTAAAPASATSADPLDLLRRVCEAGASLVRAMPHAATEGRLAARQRAALVQIASQGGARPHQLIPSLGVSRAGVAYIVDQLCAKGFVTRRRGAVHDDRRAVVLEVTEDGLGAVLAVIDAIENHREPLSELFAEIAEWPSPPSETPVFPRAARGDG